MTSSDSFDVGAAVTRSLLGWGVVAGPFYLVVGSAHGLLKPRFSFADHPLSALMLGSWGWVQAANLIATGLMVAAAAVGFRRVVEEPVRRRRSVAVALAVYGFGLVMAGVFEPDELDGFPEATSVATTTTIGALHLVFATVGQFAVVVAAVLLARWFAERGETSSARRSWVCGVVIGVSFLAGAALATMPVGIALIWLAVVTGWGWLTASSVCLYRLVPHPDRAPTAA